MSQIFQLDERKATSLPIIGIYKCLLCERRFSTKLRLKGHYCGKHDLSPHYRGEGTGQA
ncbi:MAG: hypothetical protein ABSC50_04850 [Candidatus Bathyarchaeia archaeon]